jgi:saccharopine dehydrogenase-like NADP-dependent oxidoreductase
MTKKVFIAGSGGIGEAAGLLLREWGQLDIEIYLGDADRERLARAMEFVSAGRSTAPVHSVRMDRSGAVGPDMKAALEDCSVLLDCLPGRIAPQMARYAREFGLHYANLTEYVAETDEIIAIAEGADTGFLLQTGLAPGFVNVLAMQLYDRFRSLYGAEPSERIAMKVGALTAHAHQPHFYGFTWSPIGVATEYVKASRVIRDFEIAERPALSDRETIVIGGRTYEADLTSGGAADLPDHFSGRVRSLDYKTLRYPGHYAWVESLKAAIGEAENLAEKLQAEMQRAVPSVENDLVVVHASAEGMDTAGELRMIEKAYYVEPVDVAGQKLRAIQSATAAPLCEAAMMLFTGDHRGVVLQSAVPPEPFLEGEYVSRVFK